MSASYAFPAEAASRSKGSSVSFAADSQADGSGDHPVGG